MATGAGHQMSHFEKITILIHTRNRPRFLLRAIDYYYREIGTSGVKLLILDASDSEHYAGIQADLATRSHMQCLTVLHHGPDSSFPVRLADALSAITTPFVILAADDDIYFFDWLLQALELLETDASFGVVYGHTLRFELDRYVPFGDINSVSYGVGIPPGRWLEDERPQTRLFELGKSDWATVGWYALQRVELLALIVESALQAGLDGYHLEKLLVFAQAALTRTRKLDQIYLARQDTNGDIRPPYSYKTENHALGALQSVCASLLQRAQALDSAASMTIVEHAFRQEIYHLKRNDQRRWLRLTADRFPQIRALRALLYRLILGRTWEEPLARPDPRFPHHPTFDASHPLRLAVVQLVSRHAQFAPEVDETSQETGSNDATLPKRGS